MIEFIDSLFVWGIGVGMIFFISALFIKFFIKIPLSFFKSTRIKNL